MHGTRKFKILNKNIFYVENGKFRFGENELVLYTLNHASAGIQWFRSLLKSLSKLIDFNCFTLRGYL